MGNAKLDRANQGRYCVYAVLDGYLVFNPTFKLTGFSQDMSPDHATLVLPSIEWIHDE